MESYFILHEEIADAAVVADFASVRLNLSAYGPSQYLQESFDLSERSSSIIRTRYVQPYPLSDSSTTFLMCSGLLFRPIVAPISKPNFVAIFT